MKLPESTEWVLHAAGSLALLPLGWMVSAGKLADYFELPAPYLTKQLQSLVRAGILAAMTGPCGGFRLARPPSEITLLEIVEAVDGNSPFYHCNELRQRGSGAAPPEQCRKICGIARHMHAAEAAWRASLDAVTLADIVAGLPGGTAQRTQALLG